MAAIGVIPGRTSEEGKMRSANPSPARRGERRGVPLYAVYEDADGRLMLYARGAVRELQREETEALLLNPLRRQ